MKKIVLMLLGVAATINVMAVDYTAKAKVTLEAESGYTCELMLSESAEYGALTGSVMNMTDRKVALYALNGSTKLQIAKAADLSEVKLGFMGDASTSYTLTVSAVAGSETLYIQDADSVSYALTEGAVYHFTAAANASDEARFVLKKAALPSGPSICFNYEKLQITGYAGAQLEVLNYADKSSVFAETVSGDNVEIDLEAKGLAADTQYFVKLTPAGATAALEYVIKYKPAVTVVVP